MTAQVHEAHRFGGSPNGLGDGLLALAGAFKKWLQINDWNALGVNFLHECSPCVDRLICNPSKAQEGLADEGVVQ
ncbi:hypothetical protein D9M72_554480 [compost metagenome]